MTRITECLSVGPFASAQRAATLRAAGVTHVLNVSDQPSEVSVADGFAGVAWVPMSDSKRLPMSVALRAVATLHDLAIKPDAHVYVHCVAGMVRSPTILWLYLIALGVPAKDARVWIEERAPRVNAGAAAMVDSEHVRVVQMHGLMNFFPHPRPNLLSLWPLADGNTEAK
jgi:protein-tyrosine phosphatase